MTSVSTNNSTSRLPRLLTLVPYLLARPGVSVGEAATTFGVSQQQLVDDLRLIWMCGLPGHTPADLIDVSWDGDEIIVTNADAIARPLRLAVDEASALLIALRMLSQLGEIEDRDLVQRVIAKLEHAAGDAAAAVSGQVTVQVETPPNALGIVHDALRRRRRLYLRYYVPGRDETTEREVDPMRLLVVDGRSYLEAWCRRVEAVRLFRLDRVIDVTVLDAEAEPPAEAKPRDVATGIFRPSPDDTLVTLNLTPRARWVADYYPYEEATELDNGQLRVSLRAREWGWLRRLALRLGDSARVVAPAELAEEVREVAQTTLSRYE